MYIKESFAIVKHFESELSIEIHVLRLKNLYVYMVSLAKNEKLYKTEITYLR